MIILTIILLASSTAMGCVVCNNIIPPLIGPTYSPTVAPATPTPQATITPSVSPRFITVEADNTGYQYMPNPGGPGDSALVAHPRYYRTEDWEMPVPYKGGLSPMSHGVIHELEFWNPTGTNKTISVYNIKSAFYESKDTPHKFVPSAEVFYDAGKGFFTEFTLPPHEHRTVLMYAYINDDSVYEKYRGYFIEPVSLSLIPNVPYI
ncbi:MAG TPA: hypothetical protein VMC84_10150 [Methanocella sp.]|nr:hypothetical protein [Methanocella sp.]